MRGRGRVVVWRFTDGKAGHEKQTLGLVQALKRLAPLTVHVFDVRFGPVLWRQLRGHALNGEVDVPVPDLIVGAGARTQLPMLVARFVCGGKVIVLMKPSFPHRLFDLVFVPRHDRYLRKGNLVETRGVICPEAHAEKRDGDGLILLGGANRHLDWRPEEVARQVERIARAAPEVNWRVCDSRRTPGGFGAGLPKLANVDYRHWRDTASDFLANALAAARYVWVTADSASMLYEALSAGASVGVIVLKRKRRRGSDKLSRGIRLLRLQGHVYLSSDGHRLQDSLPPPHFFSEARRCAGIVQERFLAPAPAAAKRWRVV